jgi:hypothetical protein
MSTALQYNPKLYTIVIAGIPLPAKGYAEGDFAILERTADAYTSSVGTDGQVIRVRNHDRRATFRLRLMQEAANNAILSTLHNADLKSDNGAGVGPFLMKNRAGLTVHKSPECWVKRMPDVTLSNGAQAREWAVEVTELDSFEGG